MSIFSRIFGNDQSAELAAAQARIEELENREPVTVTETEYVEVEVPVPAEMVSIVLVQWNSKTSSMTRDEYTSAYAGMPVREFIAQRFAAADLSRMSQLAVTLADNSQVTLNLDDVMPDEAPQYVGVSQTSGQGA